MEIGPSLRRPSVQAGFVGLQMVEEICWIFLRRPSSPGERTRESVLLFCIVISIL
jgi:hypothetical protein